MSTTGKEIENQEFATKQDIVDLHRSINAIGISMTTRFDAVEKRLDGIDVRLDGMDKKIESIAVAVNLLVDVVVKQEDEIADLRIKSA